MPGAGAKARRQAKQDARRVARVVEFRGEGEALCAGGCGQALTPIQYKYCNGCYRRLPKCACKRHKLEPGDGDLCRICSALEWTPAQLGKGVEEAWRASVAHPRDASVQLGVAYAVRRGAGWRAYALREGESLKDVGAASSKAEAQGMAVGAIRGKRTLWTGRGKGCRA